MLIPRHIRLNGVESHEPRLADAVRPQVRVNPEVVDGSGEDVEGVVVQEEVPIADGKGFQGWS